MSTSRSSTNSSQATAARRRRNSAPGIIADDKGREGLEALLAGHCRQAVAFLPRGVLGVATAIELLGVLPAAYRLGLPDVTDSGPRLFALLVGHNLLAAMPSPRVVPAALGLVAGVSAHLRGPPCAALMSSGRRFCSGLVVGPFTDSVMGLPPATRSVVYPDLTSARLTTAPREGKFRFTFPSHIRGDELVMPRE